MPLSEHEQRLLEQMERALLAEDPKFASSMSTANRSRADRRGVAVGVGVFIAGVALMMTGVISQIVPVGVLGFIGMLGGAFLAFRAMKSRTDLPSNVTSIKANAKKQPKAPNTLSERMEERWRQRRERGEF